MSEVYILLMRLVSKVGTGRPVLRWNSILTQHPWSKIYLQVHNYRVEASKHIQQTYGFGRYELKRPSISDHTYNNFNSENYPYVHFIPKCFWLSLSMRVCITHDFALVSTPTLQFGTTKTKVLLRDAKGLPSITAARLLRAHEARYNDLINLRIWGSATPWQH